MKSRYFRLTFVFLLALMLTASAVICPAFVAQGAEGGIRVKINDKFLSLPQPPVRLGNTTMLPFRPIYEFLGAVISWEKETNTVSATRGNIKVDLQLDNGIAVVNDEKVILNVAPQLIKGTTMVPAWFFAESLGAEVDWDSKQQVINISLASASGISLETRELLLEEGETETIAATVFPENAINKNIIWNSTFPSVAGVYGSGEGEAVISAVNPGTAIIIAATEEGGYVDTCKVTVKQGHTPVTGISLSATTLTLVAGSTPRILTAYVSPEMATNKSISWKSSQTGVATVYKNAVGRGIVAPLKEGNTIISATTEDGEYVAVCAVTVLPMTE
ncbi:MAG: stalk domain-containing protein [Dethiobacteria bacterium]|jgi:uncharacterized protein YjdB